MIVALPRWVSQAFLLLFLPFKRRTDDDDGDRRLLETIFRDRAGEQTLHSTKAAAARANDKHCGFIDLDLVVASASVGAHRKGK